MNKILIITLVLLIAVSLLALKSGEEAVVKDEAASESLKMSVLDTSLPKITFLELGSTTCIPCKKMKPVLESISKKYGDQIKVEFIDLMKDRKASKKYKIRVMPTQIFLNEKGEEVHRHVGYYPEAQIDEFLQSQGLKLSENK